MKAFQFDMYGPPEGLTMVELPDPMPGSDQVLVKVRATSVNDWDWTFVRGRPLAYRPLLGMRRPRVKVLGAEVAGDVVEVGTGVREFRPGDRVYGDLSEAGFGGFAELVAVRSDALRHMPASMSYVDATAIPHAGCLALQGLALGGLRDGMRILINGGGGGVGMLGVQLAKRRGAEVTGVDRAEKLERMKQFGFDHVLDYREVDFATAGQRYDLILDTKSTRGPRAVTKALTPTGAYVTVGGDTGALVRLAVYGALVSGRGQRVRVLALKPNDGLDRLGGLHAEGALRCAIDGPHPFDALPAMVRRFGEAQHLGKIVIVTDDA